MAIIDEKAVNMNELKKQVKALNDSGLLPEKIAIKGKKMELATAFVAGLEQCNELGRLDEVPEPVFDYYNIIVPPPADDAAATEETAPAAEQAPAAAPAPATGRTTRGAAPAAKAPAAKAAAKPKAAAKAPAAAKKATRADVFAELVTHKTPYTKEQLVEKMVAKYGGSEAEAAFQIGQMTRTVLALAAKGVLTAEINDKSQLVVG